MNIFGLVFEPSEQYWVKLSLGISLSAFVMETRAEFGSVTY